MGDYTHTHTLCVAQCAVCCMCNLCISLRENRMCSNLKHMVTRRPTMCKCARNSDYNAEKLFSCGIHFFEQFPIDNELTMPFTKIDEKKSQSLWSIDLILLVHLHITIISRLESDFHLPAFIGLSSSSSLSCHHLCHYRNTNDVNSILILYFSSSSEFCCCLMYVSVSFFQQNKKKWLEIDKMFQFCDDQHLKCEQLTRQFY